MKKTKIAYLTIDGGPSPYWEGKLNYLVDRQLPAVWFCEGGALETHPSFVSNAIAEGHVVANHSYDHPHFSDLSVKECREQITRTHELIVRAYDKIGVEWREKFFRFPYGDKGDLQYGDVFHPCDNKGMSRKADIQALLRELGYRQPAFVGITYQRFLRAGLLDDVDWYWTYDCGESAMAEENPPDEPVFLQEVFSQMDRDAPERGRGLNYLDSEDIVLIHDHVETTAMFPRIIERILSKGIQFQLPDEGIENEQNMRTH
jgi:peptidoglycan-N-acetylglucosamine deacetylase